MAGHGVECASRVEHINVEEGDEGEPDVAAAVVPVDVAGSNLLEAVPGGHLLEECPTLVASPAIVMGKLGHGTRPGPTGNGDEQNGPEKGTANTVHEQQTGQDAAQEDAQPDGWVLQDMALAEAVCILVLWQTSSHCK